MNKCKAFCFITDDPNNSNNNAKLDITSAFLIAAYQVNHGNVWRCLTFQLDDFLENLSIFSSKYSDKQERATYFASILVRVDVYLETQTKMKFDGEKEKI